MDVVCSDASGRDGRRPCSSVVSVVLCNLEMEVRTTMLVEDLSRAKILGDPYTSNVRCRVSQKETVGIK